MKIAKFLLLSTLSLVLESIKGQETETTSNRLSVPVLKVDGTFVAPTTSFFYQPVEDPLTDCALSNQTSFAVDDYCYYDLDNDLISWLQKQSSTFWQAPIVTPASDGVVIIDAIDTGDLLESGGVKSNKQLRIEFTLLQEVIEDEDDPLMAFPMQGPLLGTSGVREVHGTSAFNLLNDNGENADGYNNLTLVTAKSVLSNTAADGTTTTLNALVYTECARLSIEPTSSVGTIFNYTSGSWGSAPSTLAPMRMTTEVTVSGRITYGYVWNRAGLAPGWYRLNFYLDPACNDCATLIDPNSTAIINPGRSYFTELIAPENPEANCGGGVYIDIQLGGSGGGGGGGSGGGKKGGTATGGSGKKGSGKKGVGETYARKKVRHTRPRRHRRHHRHGHKKPNKKGGLRNRE